MTIHVGSYLLKMLLIRVYVLSQVAIKGEIVEECGDNTRIELKIDVESKT